MSQDTRGRTAPGSSDTGLVERAETLLDEAVGQAAKGSYGEAADKVRQALAIDPDNAVARDLLESYRRQVADDDERRRRRRSIAAAAAAIEEMVENDRLEEASAATEALAMQFGLDAPVDELRSAIAAARAVQLDFNDLDSAIDSIRLPIEGVAAPAPRADASGGTLVAQIEEHLRSDRLAEASSALDTLESEPGMEDRAHKMRTRIEEALEVAGEHRREEEILIATAAIEELLRRGNVDDAAHRLAELAERHGSSAPVAELRERLAEARALARQGVAQSLAATETIDGPTSDRGDLASPVWPSTVEEESRGGSARWIAIAVVVALIVLAGLWWWSQRPSATTERPARPRRRRWMSAAAAPAGAVDGAASTAPADSATATDPVSSGQGGAAPSTAAADPQSVQPSAARADESAAAARQSPSQPAAPASGNVVAAPVAREERAAAPTARRRRPRPTVPRR